MTTPTLFDWAGDFAKGFVGQRPLYVNGVKIGYWTADNNLCIGNAFIYAQYLGANKQAIYPPSQWITKDDLWKDVPVSQYCLSKNIKPQWAAVSGSTVTVPSTVQATPPVTYTQQPDGSLKPTSELENILGVNLPKLGLPVTVLLIGGAVAGLVLVSRK